MGSGRDAAREDAPEHAAILDNFKDQLFIVLIDRLGGKVDIPVSEVDKTGGKLVSFSITDNTFHFVLSKKH